MVHFSAKNKSINDTESRVDTGFTEVEYKMFHSLEILIQLSVIFQG